MATVAVFLLLGVGISRPGRPDAGCATRPGTSSTSTPTWLSLWPSAISSRRCRLRDNQPARALVGAVHRGGRAVVLVPAGHADPGALRHRLHVVGVGPRAPMSSRSTSAASTSTSSRRAGAVLPLAVPHPRAVVGGASVLPVGRRPAGPAAGDGEDRRRPQRGAGACSRAPGSGRRALRLVHGGRVASARCCCWPAAWASPRCGRCSSRCRLAGRRDHADLPGHTGATWCSTGSSTGSPTPWRDCALPARAAPSRRPTTCRPRTCRRWCPACASTTSSSAGRRGWPRRRRALRAAGVSGRRIHHESFDF